MIDDILFFLKHDVPFILVTVAFFAICIAYVRGIDRM